MPDHPELVTLEDMAREIEALRTRAQFLEDKVPQNSYERKVDDGHHHYQPVEGFDDDVSLGFGFQLNFRHGISATRDSFPTNRRFDIDAGGGICYDYIVDADFIGTAGASIPQVGGGSSIVYATIQAAIDAIDAVNNEVSLLICPGTYNETVVFPSTLAHDLYVDGLGARTVVWGLSGDALTLDGNASFWFKGIQFRGSTHSVTSAGSNVKANFENCEFDASVSADFDTPSSFLRCKFDGGYDVDSGDTPQGVFFYECSFTGTQTWASSLDDHYFLDCRWPNVNDEITVSSAADLTDIHFKGGTAGSGGSLKRWLHINTTGQVERLHIEGMSMPKPQDSNGVIYLQATNNNGQGGNIIANNSFPHTNAGTFPYITSDDGDFKGFTFLGNSFEESSGDYLEDDSSNASIDGNFDFSNFGPNTPASKVEYNITGTGNTFFPTGSAVGSSTSPAISSKIQDTDTDTSWDTEESADEDKLRGKTAGVERIVIDANGMVVKVPINVNTPSELTLSSLGAITVTQTYHRVDTFANAASDILGAIAGGGDGDLLILRPENGAHAIVVPSSSGGAGGFGIFLRDGLQYTMDDIEDALVLLFDAAIDSGAGGWLELARGATAHNILDGVIHKDSVADTVTRGSLIKGNTSSPSKWDELVVGAAETIIRVNGSGTDLAYVTDQHAITLTVEDPTSSEDIGFYFFNSAVTIQEIEAVVVGSSTPSVTIEPSHSTDRSAAGNDVLSSPTAITNTTTGQNLTAFDDASVPADSFLWLETTAKSGTVDELTITVRYTFD